MKQSLSTATSSARSWARKPPSCSKESTSVASTPSEVTLRHLLERADSWCGTRGVTCQVTADLIDRQQDFAEAIAGYTRVGSPGFRPSRLERILGPEWVDSRTEPGVQAADMVAYILRRHKEVQGSPKAQRAARSLAHVLSPAVRHERKWIP